MNDDDAREDQTLPFLLEPAAAYDDEAPMSFSDDGARGAAARQVPIGALKRNLERLSGGLMATLEGVRAVGRFELTEVTLSVEVSAEGGVSILGTGAKAAGKGAITLTFTAPARR